MSKARRDEFWLGLFLAAVAAAFLYYTTEIRLPHVRGTGDPGPRAFPVSLSLVLLAGGLAFSTAALLRRRGDDELAIDQSSAAEAAHASPRITIARVAVLLACAVYLPLIFQIGFTISSLVFVLAVMSLLGTRWWQSALTAVGLIMVVKLLFVRLFQVQLPELPLLQSLGM